MPDYIKFESILRAIPFPEGITISDVRIEDSVVKFKIEGHEFLTYGSKVIHEKNPMFNHPLTEYWANQENTAEGIERFDSMSASINAEIDMFERNKLSFYKIFFLAALTELEENGNKAFVNFIEEHIHLTVEEPKGKQLLKLIDEER